MVPAETEIAAARNVRSLDKCISTNRKSLV
jgi:hypothetical protein